MEGVKLGNDGTMNDKYHWQKAKPAKFKHSLTQVILEEAYLKNPFEAVKLCWIFSSLLLCVVNLLEHKKTKRNHEKKSSFVNDCDLSLVSKQVKTPVLPRKKVDFAGWG